MDVEFAPSPDRILTGLGAYEVSAALWSALQIDLFTVIGEGFQTIEDLAARCRASPRGVRILADYLVLKQFLAKYGNAYQLTEESRHFLNRRSSAFVGKSADFKQAPFVWMQYGRLTECVLRGGASSQDNVLEPDHDLWIRFARSMADQMAGVAQATVPLVKERLPPRPARPRRILDIASGHGMFGIAFAKDDPACQVVAQDWPKVLEVTRQNAAAAGVAERLTLIAGDVFQVDIGHDYDVVVVSNLLHYLDRAAGVRLLRKARAALAPDGLLAIAEYAPNDDRLTPPHAIFGLFVLVTAPAGDVYTVNEILAMCGEAGFTDFSVWDVPVQRLLLVGNRALGALPVGG